MYPEIRICFLTLNYQERDQFQISKTQQKAEPNNRDLNDTSLRLDSTYFNLFRALNV